MEKEHQGPVLITKVRRGNLHRQHRSRLEIRSEHMNRLLQITVAGNELHQKSKDNFAKNVQISHKGPLLRILLPTRFPYI